LNIRSLKLVANTVDHYPLSALPYPVLNDGFRIDAVLQLRFQVVRLFADIMNLICNGVSALGKSCAVGLAIQEL
jgi:hypothetical protein